MHVWLEPYLTGLGWHNPQYLAYHAWWPSSNDPWWVANHRDDSLRLAYYNVTGVPSLKLDGTNVSTSTVTTVRNAFNARSAVASPLWMKMKCTVNGTNDSVIVTLKIVSNQAITGTNYKLRIVLTEILHTIFPPSINGMRRFDYPLCDAYPDINGTIFTHSGNTNDTVSVRGAFFIRRTGTAPFTLDNSSIIAYVQNDSTKEVLQTGYQPVATVKYPIGGEVVYVTDTLRVKWDSTQFTGNVRVLLNRTYPTGRWDTLLSSATNSGNANWRITAPVTTNARIMVQQVSNPDEFDQSKNNFTIAIPAVIDVDPPLLTATLNANDTLTRTVMLYNTDTSASAMTYTGTLTMSSGLNSYTYLQTADPGGPTAQWIDISTSGIMGPHGDDSTSYMVLPFHFPFFGRQYDTVWMCTNGWLSFNRTTGTSGYSRPYPQTGYGAMIAVYWCNLIARADTGYCKWDTSGGRAVFSWINVRESATFITHFNAQAVLYPDGRIQLNYGTIASYTPWITCVGMQSEDRSQYLNIYTLEVPRANNSIRFTYSPKWASTSVTTFNLARRQSVQVPILFSSKMLDAGTYNGTFTFNGNVAPVILPLTLTVRGLGANDIVPVPLSYQLENVYPNPFNPVTTVRFTLPVASKVSLKLYDVNGRLVTELLNEKLEAGEHRQMVNGEKLASGVYFLKMKAGGTFSTTRKLVLVK